MKKRVRKKREEALILCGFQGENSIEEREKEREGAWRESKKDLHSGKKKEEEPLVVVPE